MRVTAIFRERMFATSAAVLLLALATGGCSSVSSMLPESMTPSSSSSIFSTAPSASAAQNPADQGIRDATDFECPSVTVRTGTSTLIITEKTKGEAADSPLSLKYQGTIVNTARECKYAAGIVTMKVGIEGRIITGPAGGPGQVDVPLRIAVVHEGPQPKVVLSKLARLSVAVTDSSGATFTHIDPEISFPMPRPAGEIDSYVVYVGYDQQALEPAKKPRATSRKRR
jgi:hypothetical protein